MTSQKWLKDYSELGFKLFPAFQKSKIPRIKNNIDRASSDLKQLQEWEKEFGTSNWGLSLAKSGLVVVDVDKRNSGLEKWEEILKGQDVPPALWARSGGGGLHYVFKAKQNVHYKSQIVPGIDIKFNGYIIVEPSTHPSGGEYRWGVPLSTSIPNYPDWLAELIEKDNIVSNVGLSKVSSMGLGTLVDEVIKFELSYHEWIQVGMSIHSVFPDEEGLEFYKMATRNRSFRDGDTELAAEKWSTFSTNRSNSVGIGTLIYLIKSKGGSLLAYRIAEGDSLLRDESSNPGTSEFIGHRFSGENIVWARQEDLVASLNSAGYFFLEESGGQFIGQLNSDSESEQRVLFFKSDKFKAKLAPYKLEISDERKSKLFNSDEVWIKSRNRRVYSRIRFSPKARPGELNLWHSPFLEPLAGDCSLLLNLIRDSLCDGNEINFNWLIRWYAHIFQFPGVKVTSVPVFVSTKEGVGKGLVNETVMRKILGTLYVKVCGLGSLTRKFNDDLSKRWLTYIDEASIDDDKHASSVLKGLTGSEKMTVEYKYGTVHEVDNFSRYIVASNSEYPIDIGFGNRRFAFFECSNRYANKQEYFAPIYKELSTGKLTNYFYNYLALLC
jgi:hypothetical protein